MRKSVFDLSRFDYEVPPELVAQDPAAQRDSSRLLIVDRKNKRISQGVFRDVLELFKPGDVMVLNDTKVLKARLFGRSASGAKIEVLLIKERSAGVWEVLVKPGRKARLGDTIEFETGVKALISDKTSDGGRVLEFTLSDISEFLERCGKAPTPPYIKRLLDDPGKYQTVYAKAHGAIAAPTAGLHFTPQLLAKIPSAGVKIVYVTLHCGLATFRPVKVSDIRQHPMLSEWIEVSEQTAQTINQAKRVIAVGTTSVRTLESAGQSGTVKPWCGPTSLYITPGYKFKIVDALITNFHTPCSTNLVLVSCFCGHALLKKSYAYALKEKFRFWSFGDAMMIL